MRRALIVGIDDYKWAPLDGCEEDANRVTRMLEKHDNGAPNFDCQKLISSEAPITRTKLRMQIHQLFANEAEVALLYFSGHGADTCFGGMLVTQDAVTYDEGVALNDILIMANNSKAREVIILIDCCYSGHMGNHQFSNNNLSILREGISILASSREYQVSRIKNKSSILTEIICEALDGEAADILGKVNVAGIYMYADKVLSSWEQRPLFKANVSTMIPVRDCYPRIPLHILRKLSSYFPKEQEIVKLGPEYEISMEPSNMEKELMFSHLQMYASAGLVDIDYENVEGKDVKSFPLKCHLTHLGQFYWKLAKYNRV